MRKKLAEGGKAAIAASTDPLIRLAYDLDPQARAVRKRYEDEVQGVDREAYEKIGVARFAVYGEDSPPDATGSLRMTYGTISGYAEGNTSVPAFTDFAGMYERWADRKGDPAFTLTDKWLEGKDSLDLDTPYNFALSTRHYIGATALVVLIEDKVTRHGAT